MLAKIRVFMFHYLAKMWAIRILFFLYFVTSIRGFNEEHFMQTTVKLVKQRLPSLEKGTRKALKDFVKSGKNELKEFLEKDLEIRVPPKVKNYQKYANFLIRNEKISLEQSNKIKEFVRKNQWDYVKFAVELLDLKPQDYGVSGLTFCDKVLICEYVSEVSTVKEDENDTLDNYFNSKFANEDTKSGKFYAMLFISSSRGAFYGTIQIVSQLTN